MLLVELAKSRIAVSTARTESLYTPAACSLLRFRDAFKLAFTDHGPFKLADPARVTKKPLFRIRLEIKVQPDA